MTTDVDLATLYVEENGSVLADWVDGKRVLSVGDQDNPIVMMWDIASGSLLFQTAPAGAGLLDVAALGDGRHCLTCGKDATIRLWQWKR